MGASSDGQNAVGIDIIEIERVEAALGRFGGGFLRRVYTEEESAFGRGRVHELAARFAAKEAVMKALGTGAKGVAWREIEVLPNHRGKPLVYLYGRAKGRGEGGGVPRRRGGAGGRSAPLAGAGAGRRWRSIPAGGRGAGAAGAAAAAAGDRGRGDRAEEREEGVPEPPPVAGIPAGRWADVLAGGGGGDTRARP